jgi:hypothetical protein
METQKKYSGLICLSILPSKYRQLDHRPEVLAITPEVYEDGPLVHPAVPGLILTKEQRLFFGNLEVVNCENDFLWREESKPERVLRIKWKEPVSVTRSSTDKDFVDIDMSLFKTEFSVPPKPEQPKPKHYYPSDIEAHEKKVADEKALLRLKKEAAAAAHKAKEEINEKEAAAAAAEAMTGLAKLRDYQTSAVAARKILKETKQENGEKSHLQNLEWRLASVLSRLQWLIDDIEAGKPLGELQTLAGENLEDEIEIMGNEIALLRRAIQILKGRIQR